MANCPFFEIIWWIFSCFCTICPHYDLIFVHFEKLITIPSSCVLHFDAFQALFTFFPLVTDLLHYRESVAETFWSFAPRVSIREVGQTRARHYLLAEVFALTDLDSKESSFAEKRRDSWHCQSFPSLMAFFTMAYNWAGPLHPKKNFANCTAIFIPINDIWF